MTVVIHYVWHPLRGRELAVATGRGPCEQVRVVAPDGHVILVPEWMLDPSSAAVVVQDQPEIHGKACMGAADLLRMALTACEAAKGRDTGQDPGYRGGKPRRRRCDNEISTSSTRPVPKPKTATPDTTP